MFDPEEFAKLAIRLVQNPCGHAESRTAISRAYYATFLELKQFLDPHFHFGKGAVVHEQVQMLFVNCSDKQIQDVGRKLDELRKRRNAADYNLEDGNVNSYHIARIQNAVATRTRDTVKNICNCLPSRRIFSRRGARGAR